MGNKTASDYQDLATAVTVPPRMVRLQRMLDFMIRGVRLQRLRTLYGHTVCNNMYAGLKAPPNLSSSVHSSQIHVGVFTM